jgi:hypothetical protein
MIMPRKQRFKPSRKPKPIPQSEAAAIGHDARDASSHGGAHNDNVESSGSVRRSDEDSPLMPEPDPH